MEKHIAVSKADREFLMKLFNVTERTVWNALSDKHKADNGLHMRIRKAAMERGGIVMAELPEEETIHYADGTMQYSLPNGAVFEMSTRTGAGTVWHRGEAVLTYDNVLVREIPAIQKAASALK